MWLMRVVGVALVALMVACVGEAASRTMVHDNGYTDVVVAISPSVDEANGNNIIAGLKATLKETSKALFRATRNRIYFKNVKILIPSSWTSVPVDQQALNENFEDSDIKVDIVNPVYGIQPYTMQPGGCQEPGQYIHLSPEYLTTDEGLIWGPKGKVLTQAWARLRWGVFDEMGYAGDDRFPLFYQTWNDLQELIIKPNYCADRDILGQKKDIVTLGPCKYVNNLPDDNCRFVPNKAQEASSSLMSYAYLDSINDYCDSGEKKHDPYAPTRHNLMCQGTPVWDIIEEHSDFENATSLPSNTPVDPEVLVVQQTAAKFALVLDHSGSMFNDKIEVLINTAKRWLLHDVADGSFVTIINFGSSSTVVKGLTEVSNSTRQELADAINDDGMGSTCIGCGLRSALSELKNHTNKVILLITDGQENESPTMDDMMDDVVKSGARVVTISYGRYAEEKLEELAVNTGGKVYIVPDDDDGSAMDDAFQGSLTYQPGQSLENINVKIADDEQTVAGGGTMNGTFIVDSTLGRNLEFRLDSDQVLASEPFLTSPNGTTYTDVEFTSDINLYIITVDVAETGEWQWEATTGPRKTHGIISVTAEAKDPDTLPICTESWMSTGVDFVNASAQNVIVYAKVTQGSKPVVGAKVRAYITTPDPSVGVELDLLDNGQAADVQKGDGVYSRYFTQFVSTGRYAVKAQVWDDGSSYINNGFITSRRRRSNYRVSERSLHPLSPPGLLGFTRSASEIPPDFCCGSVVPFDPSTATPTGEFTRSVAAGSFNVVSMPSGGGGGGGTDAFPPSRVTDLQVTANSTSLLLMQWTAPGDNFDMGTVYAYQVRLSENVGDLMSDSFEFNTVPLLDVEESSNITELLLEAGNEVKFEIHLEDHLKRETLYFVALKAVDASGQKSPVSNAAPFIIASGGKEPQQGMQPWLIAVIAIASIASLVLIIGVSYCICKKIA